MLKTINQNLVSIYQRIRHITTNKFFGPSFIIVLFLIHNTFAYLMFPTFFQDKDIQTFLIDVIIFTFFFFVYSIKGYYFGWRGITGSILLGSFIAFTIHFFLYGSPTESELESLGMLIGDAACLIIGIILLRKQIKTRRKKTGKPSALGKPLRLWMSLLLLFSYILWFGLNFTPVWILHKFIMGAVIFLSIVHLKWYDEKRLAVFALIYSIVGLLLF